MRLTLVFWVFFLRTLAGIMAFLFAKKEFDVRKILFFLFRDNINICCKYVLVLTLFLFIMVPRISLVVIVFFVGLMSRRLLFPTRYISERSVSRLIFSGVLILNFCWSVTSKTFSINLLPTKE